MILAILFLSFFQAGGAQAAIDAAPSGSVVRVRTGSSFETITIRKPLTVLGVGNPPPTFGWIVLAGNGGSLTLGNLHLSSPAFWAHDIRVRGSGFQALRLHEIDCAGLVWLKDDLDYLEVNACRLAPNTPGQVILAPSALVTMLDTEIRPYAGYNAWPTVESQSLYQAGSTSTGYYQTRRHILAEDLSLVGEPRLGGSLRLSWSTPRRFAWVYYSVGSKPPRTIPGAAAGYDFLLDPTPLTIDVSPGFLDIPIPMDLALLGTETTYQVWNGVNYYSRPCMSLIR